MLILKELLGEKGYYLCSNRDPKNPRIYLKRGKNNNCKWKIYEINSLHGHGNKLNFIC